MYGYRKKVKNSEKYQENKRAPKPIRLQKRLTCLAIKQNGGVKNADSKKIYEELKKKTLESLKKKPNVEELNEDFKFKAPCSIYKDIIVGSTVGCAAAHLLCAKLLPRLQQDTKSKLPLPHVSYRRRLFRHGRFDKLQKRFVV